MQSANIAERITAGRAQVGRKIGLTSPVVQRQLGVDRPDFGVLLRRHGSSRPGRRPMHSGLLQPRAEAEVAFVLGADLDDGALDARSPRRRRRTPGRDRDRATAGSPTGTSRIGDTVADNASSGAVRTRLGAASRSTSSTAPSVQMTLELNGDDGLHRQRRGLPRRPAQRAGLAGPRPRATSASRCAPGEVVLSGALGPMVATSARVTGSPLGSTGLGVGRRSVHRSTEGRSVTTDVQAKTKVAIIGSGNIGTDLMIKVIRDSPSTWRWPPWSASTPTPTAWPGPAGWACRPPRTGSTGLLATAGVRRDRASSSTPPRPGPTSPTPPRWRPHGKRLVDLTPAAIGPYVVPRSTSTSTWTRRNVNMVTCGGQATIPMVAAVARVAPVALRRDRRLHRLQVGRPRHPRQHRRVHRDDGARDRAGRRRRPRQGDHRAQPGRAAADHAGHRVLPASTTRDHRRDRGLGRGDGRRGRRVRARLPAQAAGPVHPDPGRTSRCTPCCPTAPARRPPR